MGLKSARWIGGLERARELRFGLEPFDLCKAKGNGSQFRYMVDGGPSPAMTAVGLLCREYMGTKRTDPTMMNSIKYLMENMPDVRNHNIYYWYYATQV